MWGMLASCSTSHLVTHTVFETPTQFVRLAVDQTVSLDSGFSHPATIPADTMKAILGGLTIVEPASLIPWPFQKDRPLRHPLFSEADIRLWAPVLAKALDSATPEEVVTFYQSDDISAVSREVTSGGLFVKDQILYFMLSNYRAPSQFMADIGMADTHDDRRFPLRSMAPQQFTLQFEPDSLVVAPHDDNQSVGLSFPGTTIAVLFRQLPARSSGLASDQDTFNLPAFLNPQP
jgi:hypothetical protein